MKIGAIAESFKKPLAQAAKLARGAGIEGLQLYANTQTVHAGMNAKEIAEVKNILAGEGLHISALCGDFGCAMYYTKNRAEIDREKRILELAKELQVQKSTLSEWLRDKNEPPMGMIVKIALYLNVSTDYLLGLESETGGRMV